MKRKGLSILFASAFIFGLALTGFFTVGFAGLLFSAAFAGGFILWLLTTFRQPVEPDKIIVPYLITVIFFIVHVFEEYVFHIERVLTQLSGFEVTQQKFLIIAAFAAPVVWLSGAVMLIKRWDFGYFFVSTFLFGMMFAELSHFVSPFLEDGTFHYSPGMFTALLPVISGWLMFGIVLREMKTANRDLEVRNGE